MMAVCTNVSEMTGRMRCSTNAPKPWFGGTQPLAGSTPMKAATSRIATRKLGTATPICVTMSTTADLRRAAYMPSGTAMSSVNAMVTPHRIAETCILSSTSGVMFFRVASEMPKLPRSSPPIHEKYCTISGRSVPSCAVSFATAASVAVVPRATRAGSPGTMRSSTKITTDAATSEPTKRPRSFIISRSLPVAARPSARSRARRARLAR